MATVMTPDRSRAIDSLLSLHRAASKENVAEDTNAASSSSTSCGKDERQSGRGKRKPSVGTRRSARVRTTSSAVSSSSTSRRKRVKRSPSEASGGASSELSGVDMIAQALASASQQPQEPAAQSSRRRTRKPTPPKPEPTKLSLTAITNFPSAQHRETFQTLQSRVTVEVYNDVDMPVYPTRITALKYFFP